jgi:hypothetical protein
MKDKEVNSDSLEDYFESVEIYNNSNNADNETPKYDPDEKDRNTKRNINYMLPRGGQTGEVEMEDVGNLCVDIPKLNYFNKQENGNEKNETNITNKPKVNNDTNNNFDSLANDSRSEEVLSLSENISQNNNSYEVNTLCERNIFQENQTLPKQTIDGKPHLVNVNKREKEDKIYRKTFDNSLSSKEDEDDWSQIYNDIYYVKIYLEPCKVEPCKVEPFNYSIYQQKYKNNINFEENYQYFSLEVIFNEYGDFFIKLYPKIFKDEDELVKMEEFGICKKIVNYLKAPEDEENKKIEDNKHQVMIKQESEENISKKSNIRKDDRDKMMLKILTKLASSFRKATNSFKEFKIRKIKIINPKLINEKLDAYFIFEYLRQHLYAILSNESSKDTNIESNKSIIEEIMKENNKEKEVIKHLYLTVQKCLDYFRYKEENENFKYKLVDFLIEEFEFQTKKKGESISFSKEYIASLLLLTYNFERFFQIRKKNSENMKKKKNQLFVVKKRLINKISSKNKKYNPKKSKRNRNINDIDEPFNCSSKKKIISLDTSDSSINNSLSRKNPFLTRMVFQENQISSKIEEINKSNNQSLNNDNDSMQNNGKIKDNKKQNIFSVIKDNDKII